MQQKKGQYLLHFQFSLLVILSSFYAVIMRGYIGQILPNILIYLIGFGTLALISRLPLKSTFMAFVRNNKFHDDYVHGTILPVRIYCPVLA